MSHWSLAYSIPLLALAAAVWAGAGWLCWAQWDRTGRRRRVAALESLRFMLITLLTATLFRPEFVRQLQRKEEPEVNILIDASRSMQTRDVVSSNGVVSRAEWVRQVAAQKFWKPLQKHAKISVEQFSPPPATNQPASMEGTDLAGALEAALQRHPALKAVLLVTDGDWNIGKSPIAAATAYREQSIPIFSVAVGRENPLPDLILDSADAPAYGLFGEEISIPFKIVSHLSRDVTTTVGLWTGGVEVAKKPITIPAQSDVEDILLWSPKAVGPAKLTLKAPVEADEAFAENNQRSFQINVRVQTLKVLVVDSLPRWEYRYLRNALARDPGVEMNSVLFRPGLGPGGGPHYLSHFPSAKEEISKYDVIFLGDVGIGQDELTEQDAALIRGLVEQQASGLIFLPGRRGREMTFLDSPLKDLLPVQLDNGQPQGIGLHNESQLILTSSGRNHWLTRFAADERANVGIWKNLPGFFWSAAVDKSLPGSDVLAVHSELRNAWGRIPLLVTRPFGSGNVLFMGTDSAWRWRRGVEDKYHYRFWSQVVRWMAHQRHLSEKEGIRLAYTPEAPQTGDSVFLQATVLDAAGYPLQHGAVEGAALSPSGRAERLDFTELEGGWGVYKSKFSPEESGAYKLTVSSGKSGRQLETTLSVAAPNREKLGQPINRSVLAELAQLTGARCGSTESLPQIVNQISALPEPKPAEERLRIWCDPRWGGFLLVLLGIYWTGRKLAGMI